MTKRTYEPNLKAQVASILKLAEAHDEAQRKRREAIEKVRRDLYRLRETGTLPPSDAA